MQAVVGQQLYYAGDAHWSVRAKWALSAEFSFTSELYLCLRTLLYMFVMYHLSL